MYKIKPAVFNTMLCFGLFPWTIRAQHVKTNNVWTRASHDIAYQIETQSTISSTYSPLWLNANRHGLSSVKGDNGYFRAGFFRGTEKDSSQIWRIGYGMDLAVAYNFTNTFTLHQLYADFEYKKIRLSIGSKERTMALKNQRLSSGGQTFGINARPIPEMRIEVPQYISLTGKSDWIGFKGHFGYGFMTDGSWQKDYVHNGTRYAKHALYHSKAGYLRIGNERKFPIVFEGGLEMACQFGGTIYNPKGYQGLFGDKIEMGSGLKDFVKAIYGGGSDATDDIYANAAGNTVGSWLFSLSYKGKNWKIRTYIDHFFEDHSQMFLEYGWKDGILGIEVTLPQNPVVSQLVYEYCSTTDQSGPVYHDHSENIPDQISGVDNYYNHNLYQGWQHWGQSIGNPLFHSPLYNNNGMLEFTGNRFRAHHLGISGQPSHSLDYRLLYTYMENWGTYALPYSDKKYCTNFLAEATYNFSRIGKLDMKGWSLTSAFAFDRGREMGDNTGVQFTIRKTGLLLK